MRLARLEAHARWNQEDGLDEAVGLVHDIFGEILKGMPDSGLHEEGLIFIGRK